MYFGESQTRLDDKGRITVPRRMRDTMRVLGHDVWYMTQGFDHAVFLFHRDEWNKIRGQVSRYSSMDARALDFRRLLFGSVAEVRVDRQGRVPVAPHLREHAGLDEKGDSEAVLIGVDDHLELWSKNAWRAFKDSQEADFKEMATRLFVGEQGGDAPSEEKGGPGDDH